MEVIYSVTPYKVRMLTRTGCGIYLRGERMEKVKEFKQLGSVLCIHGSMEGEIRDTAVKGKQVIGSLQRILKGRK